MKQGLRNRDDQIAIQLAALEGSAAAAAICDLDGRLTYVNAAFVQLWRFESSRKALGRHVSEFWVNQHGADEVMDHLLLCEMSWTGELTALREDGTKFPALVAGKIVRDCTGIPIALTGTFFDLTSSKRSESLLKLQSDLGFAMSSAKTLDEALNAALDVAISTTEMDSGGIYLVESDGAIRLRCHRGLSDIFLRSVACFTPDSEEARAVLRGEPVYSPRELSFLAAGSFYAQEGLRAFGGVPIKLEGKVLAWMNVASHTMEEFQDDCRSVLENIASLLGGPLVTAIKRQECDVFINTTTDSLGIIDRTGRILEVNEAYCRMLGYTREEFLGKHVADIEAKESEEDTRRHIQHIQENGHDRFFSRLRHKNGSIVDVDISVRYINIRGGVFFAFARDITAQVEAQKQLEYSEARYRAVVESQTELICRFDANCRLTFVNEAYCRYYARSREDLLGVDWLTLIPENERAPLKHKLAALNPMDPVITYNLRVTLPDGTIRWQEWSDCAIFDASGKFLEFQSTGRDITERKLAVEARLEVEKEAAAQRALETQRLLSIRSDRLRALGEMAAGIAHELNQPLVGVRGLAEHLLLAIKRGWNLDPERIQKKLQGIVDQADRMSHIIQHVRTFSRRSGKASYMRINLNDVVAAALELMEAQLRSCGIVVQRRLNVSLPEVLANPFSLEEVVLNCLTNARDAIEERAAASNQAESPCLITLRTRIRGRGKGRQVLLDITDTGTGISPERLEKVFDPFYTTKGPDRGTGLGLPISKSIVEDCGGTLTLQSRPMSGTIVTVALPVGGFKG